MNIEKIYSFNFYRKKFHQLFYIYKYLFSNHFYNKYKNNYNKYYILNIEDTIDELINTKKSFSRFGDGELCFMRGRSYVGGSFQKYNKKLSYRLKEVFNSNDSNIMIGVPDFFKGFDNVKNNTKKFWKFCIGEMGNDISNQMNPNRTYYNATSTRPYMDYCDRNKSKKYFEKWKTFFKNKNILIIEGNGTRLGICNDLISESRNIKRLICPSKNAFSYYEKILNSSSEFLQNNKDYISLVALGPTATVLSYDLSKRGYRSIDIGHIDVEYEWYLMGAKEKVNLKYKYVNEIGNGHSALPISDSKFDKEVVSVIK